MSYISLLDEYIKKGLIFEPLEEPVRSKSRELFRRICSKISGSYINIQGFNNFIDEVLPRQIADLSFVSNDDVEIIFDQVEVFNPTRVDGKGKKIPLYPNYCREKRHPYLGEIYVRCTTISKNKRNEKRIKLGNIPIMLMSNKCNLYGKTKEQLVQLGECVSDPFGYFIIYAERIVVAADKVRKVIPFVYKDHNSKTNKNFIDQTYSLSKKCILTLGKKWNTIKMKDPTPVNRENIKSIPIFFVYKLLADISPQKAIEDYIIKLIPPSLRKKARNALDESVIKAKNEDAVMYIYEKKGKYNDIERKNNVNFDQEIKNRFEQDIYVNINNVKSKKKRVQIKLHMLSFLVAKLILNIIGEHPIDSKDNWSNKIFENAPALIKTLFGAIMNMVINECKKLKNSDNNVDYIFFSDFLRQKAPNQLSKVFFNSFNTGTWGVGGYIRENHAEQYRRETPLVSWSISNKCVGSASPQIKETDPMQVQPSQRNRHCVIETPEGQQIGLVKYSSLTGIVSIERDDIDIYRYLEKKTSEYSEKTPYLILINGKAFYNDIKDHIAHGDLKIKDYLIELKRTNKIPIDTEINIENKLNIITIYTDASRPLCPYLIINQKSRKLKIDEDDAWDKDYEELITSGYIELLSAREEENQKIVICKSTDHLDETREKYFSMEEGDNKIKYGRITNYSHCNINPNQMFSISASTCPMVNRQLAPRGTYQASMGKQALGFYNLNYHLRYDATFKQLYRAGRSITETDTYFIPSMDLMPSGQIANIAFIADADNQEDAVVVSEDYIKAKNLTYNKFKTVIYIQNKQVAGAIEKFKIPPIKPGQDPRIYRNLDENGFPKLDSYFETGDCIIGKVLVTPEGEKNTSIFTDSDEVGYIDRIVYTNDKESQKHMIKIRLKITRSYIAGDKMALRYAQKGTIGRVVTREQMIRVSSGPNKGITPDILFNQHGFPTRSTVGLLIEGLITKAALYNGERVDVSSFNPVDIDKAQQILEDNGFDKNGYEEMEMPDGTPLKGKVFFVPLYEQALRHQVLDKIQFRNTGPRSFYTHQPQGGRKRGKGLRVGEMEKDSFVAHGASAVIKERLMKSSDEYRLIICTKCGTIVNDKICKICGSENNGMVVVPYVFKLLIHLMLGTGIDIRINVKQ